MLLRVFILLSGMCLPARNNPSSFQGYDFSGTYKYEVKDTPYGNFAGSIKLAKGKEGYKVEIVNNKGEQFSARIVHLRDTRIILATNFEHSDAMLYGYFKGDSLSARIEAKGDPFLYKLVAHK
ncbi:hypothetical protein [Chitinophaga rhizophila]|uniref:Uncharacterized protein n=1 Tax=Chitinophaga rhizophila TaxID=2866212 RepID=A0ABS7GEB3_9BACT|nr:hypothetical protein [Chitinophaga rhizophila]MBW8686004.1 hypothetical protein [Chitinophaga rhizophila]